MKDKTANKQLENSWKQPIPTAIHSLFSDDALARAILFEILTLCTNEDRKYEFWSGNKHFKVSLKRGQCIFKVARYAKQMKMDRRKIDRAIVRIKARINFTVKREPFGLVITVKNYNSLVKM